MGLRIDKWTGALKKTPKSGRVFVYKGHFEDTLTVGKILSKPTSLNLYSVKMYVANKFNDIYVTKLQTPQPEIEADKNEIFIDYFYEYEHIDTPPIVGTQLKVVEGGQDE
jgi:hypothetical protein